MSKLYAYTMAVACKNFNGEPDLFVCTVEATQDEFNNGDCYDNAIEIAVNERYEGPYVAFDYQDVLRLENGVSQYHDLQQENRLHPKGPFRQAHLLRLIEQADAMIIDGSPLLSECEIDRDDKTVIFSWHDPDFSEPEVRTVNFEDLDNVEPMDPADGSWLITTSDKETLSLHLYSLKACR